PSCDASLRRTEDKSESRVLLVTAAPSPFHCPSKGKFGGTVTADIKRARSRCTLATLHGERATRYMLARPCLPINSIILACRKQYAIFWAKSRRVSATVARSFVVNDCSPSGINVSQSATLQTNAGPARPPIGALQ